MLQLEHIDFKFKPKILVLITTYQCTAECKNCCFQAGPNKKGAISLEQSYQIIDEAKEVFPDIGLFVLTGGEPFLLKIDNLVKMIKYAKDKELHTRIVSNCFWATSESKTKEYIKRLYDVGLNEFNISTGDEHLEFVDLDNVINACIESVRQNIVTVINIESKQNSQMTQKVLENHPKFKEFFKIEKHRKLLKIINGKWVEFSEKNYGIESADEKSDLGEQMGCDSMFDTLPVFPDGSIKSCCGLTVNNIKEFNLGNLKVSRLEDLYNLQFNNFVNFWIKIEGPQKILSYLKKQNPSLEKYDNTTVHICDVCSLLFNKQDIRETLIQNYVKKIPEVFFKYKVHKQLNNL